MRQPFFVLGIEDVEQAKGSAFGAAGTFFFTFLVSMLYTIRQARTMTLSSSESNSTSSSVGSLTQWRNPYADRPAGTTALFQDYDQLDSSIPNEELESRGVFS